ncbi:MAG TPA: resolvase [Crinalium sp.]
MSLKVKASVMLMDTEASAEWNGLMDIEAVQKTLNRSRASIYRYANTDPAILNSPYDPTRLNPELRLHKDDVLLFHPNEVARFAKDVLKIKNVTIEVLEAAPTPTQELLQAILSELQGIHQLLKERS